MKKKIEVKKDWLWDKKLSKRQIIRIMNNPADPRFISLTSLLLTRKNIPKEVFGQYLKPEIFCFYWKRIKRKMRRDAWNNPRIEFWQAIYEKLSERYPVKRGEVFPQAKAVNKFCLGIGQKLKILRKQRNFTQRMLAKKLNISQQMISRIESGRENVSLLTLKKIIEELGAKISIEEVKR